MPLYQNPIWRKQSLATVCVFAVSCNKLFSLFTLCKSLDLTWTLMVVFMLRQPFEKLYDRRTTLLMDGEGCDSLGMLMCAYSSFLKNSLRSVLNQMISQFAL